MAEQPKSPDSSMSSFNTVSPQDLSSSSSSSSSSDFSSVSFSPTISSASSGASEDAEEIVELDTEEGEQEHREEAGDVDFSSLDPRAAAMLRMLAPEMEALASEAADAMRRAGLEIDENEEEDEEQLEAAAAAFLASPGARGPRHTAEEERGDEEDDEEDEEDEETQDSSSSPSFLSFVGSKLFNGRTSSRAVYYGKLAALSSFRWAWMAFSSGALLMIPFVFANQMEFVSMQQEMHMMKMSQGAPPPVAAGPPADASGSPGFSPPPLKLGGNAAGIPSQ